MEYRSLVDTTTTSLNLNLKPFPVLAAENLINQEMRSSFNFVGLDTEEAPLKQENDDVLMEELNRVNEENKKLTQMLTIMSGKYDTLRKHLIHHINIDNPAPAPAPAPASNKRKLAAGQSITTAAANHRIHDINHNTDANNTSEKSSCNEGSSKIHHITKPIISRVYVRREASDTSLTVKDGYKWRKYGQKVTRNNPSPRAYFKCSFAPTCPVKKKVQGSIEDKSIIVATYEGEHKHPHPTAMFEPVTPTSISNSCVPITPLGSVSCSTSLNTSGPVTITLDLTKSTTSYEELSLRDSYDHRISSVESPEFQQLFIHQMASSLTSNPSFKAALAAAISNRSC